VFAIVKTGGKQYRVSEGDVIQIEKLSADVDSDVVFDQVLAVYDDGELVAGQPYVDGAKAVGRVVEHGKGDKILVYKYKPRKKYRKLRGHRQLYTQVRIDSIEV
jgi:large subunit ribosomal protein L21